MSRDNQPHAYNRSQGNTPVNARRLNKINGGSLYRETRGNIALLFDVNEALGIDPTAAGVGNVGQQTIPAGSSFVSTEGDSLTPIFNNASAVGAAVPFIRFWMGGTPISAFLPLVQVVEGNMLVGVPISPNGANAVGFAAANFVSVGMPPWRYPTYCISFDRVEFNTTAAFRFQAYVTKGDAAVIY